MHDKHCVALPRGGMLFRKAAERQLPRLVVLLVALQLWRCWATEKDRHLRQNAALTGCTSLTGCHSRTNGSAAATCGRKAGPTSVDVIPLLDYPSDRKEGLF